MLMTEAPLLAFPDFTLPFMLETDASKEGLGAVLAQRNCDDNSVHLIAYASRTLLPHEKNYAISELQGLGVVWAVKHFRHYLYGHKCYVYTDHEALKALINTPHPSELARWGLALQEMDLEICYRPGKRNANADALSRAPIETTNKHPFGIVASLSPKQPLDKDGEEVESLAHQQRADSSLRPIIEYISEKKLPEDEKRAKEIILSQDRYTLVQDELYHVDKDGRLRIIPPTCQRKKLFEEVHHGTFGGHLRDGKVYGQLSRHYWWPKMRSEIVTWCRSCLKCTMRRVGKAEHPPLTPIPVAGPFDRVGVDIIQFPKSHMGNKYAIVFIDYLTKWPEVFATPDQSALTIARILVENIVSRHGVPSELLSDRGAAFLSRLVKEVCKLLGVKKTNTTAYHPQTDGLVERFNRTLTDMLAKTVEKSGRNWDVQLPYVLFAYQSSPQESTLESPFFLLYGRDPKLPTEEALRPTPLRSTVDIADYRCEVLQKMQEAWDSARGNIKKAQKRQKKFYDRRSRTPTFRVGDRVFLHVPSARSGQAYKFALSFKGPYRITKVTDNVADIILIGSRAVEPLRVSISRLRHCPEEIVTAEETRPPKPPLEENNGNPMEQEKEETNCKEIDNESSEEEKTCTTNLECKRKSKENFLLHPVEGRDTQTNNTIDDVGRNPLLSKWSGRLRSRSWNRDQDEDVTRTSRHKDGEM